YDLGALLRQGYPHRDVHSPGYILLLGGLMRVVRGGYWTAVALNALAYLLGAWLVADLTLGLGGSRRAALRAALLFFILPIFLAYVFWAMAELVLAVLFLASLVAAVRGGATRRGACAAAGLFAAAILVRESAIFGLPALWAALHGRGRVRLFSGVLALLLIGVYWPLSLHRAHGGANFWQPAEGGVAGVDVLRAARQGRVLDAVALAATRAQNNWRELLAAPLVEQGILALYAVLFVMMIRGHARRPRFDRRLRWAYLAGWSALVAILFGVYVIVEWSGFRYMMFLVPPSLAFLSLKLGEEPRRMVRRCVLAVIVALSAAGVAQSRALLDNYKASRQKRQNGIVEYVERFIGRPPMSRIILPNGWLYGYQRYPVEVISSPPKAGGEIRRLEQDLWFDYLVLPGNSELKDELDGRARYRRVNPRDEEAPLLIYKRLK
ncbi:MAG: hypothetical protein MUF51_01535, partial [Vicinamibacteria bacterium]|nr:hypothetical protein [Vicinamibacteria bacterium]